MSPLDYSKWLEIKIDFSLWPTEIDLQSKSRNVFDLNCPIKKFPTGFL